MYLKKNDTSHVSACPPLDTESTDPPPLNNVNDAHESSIKAISSNNNNEETIYSYVTDY